MAIQSSCLFVIYVAVMMLFYGVCKFFIATADDLKRCLADLEDQTPKFIRSSKSEQTRVNVKGMIIKIIEFHSDVLQ